MIVDLYAGPGGWDEGMRMLGITEPVIGIEWDHQACRTAMAAGHLRVRADVATYSIAAFAGADGVIGSPPCQAWSMAGNRKGELDRARVHELVDAYADGGNDPGTGWVDERSHHAAQPVRWIRDLRPQWVALEQVPPVLDLWQHIAIRLRRWGYSTWVGVLNAADYGVPQTRQRAVLVARLDGPARPPEPTHAREPGDLDLFGGQLRPWVSMASALGWGMTDRPTGTVTGGGGTTGGAEPFGNGTRQGMRAERDAGRWADGFDVVSNYTATGKGTRGRRSGDQPSATLTGKADRMKVTEPAVLDRRTNSAGPRGTTVPSAPISVDRPAPTVTSGTGTQWVLRNGSQDNACERPAGEPAGTLFFGHRATEVRWYETAPATTVQGDPRIGRPGHKGRKRGGESQFAVDSVSITQTEAAVLQSFPSDYPWQGTKTKQFEQIGNAVPPRLAAHIVAALTGRPFTLPEGTP